MADGEYRKLQITGGSTTIVSLPKDWISQNELRKGDVVSIEEMSSGDLRISTLQGAKNKTSITIDCCKVENGLLDLMIGAYLSGADAISIVCSKPISRSVRSEIRGFLRDTRGMEIESDKEKEIRIVSLLNPSELKLQVSVNRMYILISGLVNDSFSTLSGDSNDLLQDIEDRERQIDARRLLIERQVAAALKMPSVEKRLAIDRFSAMEHASIARVLERMGDHATRLAVLVRENNDEIRLQPAEMPLRAIPLFSAELRELVHNMYTKDIPLIHGAKSSLAKIIKDIEVDEGELWTGRRPAERLYAEFQISESIRRLCAYAVNFAELLLNMLMHEQLETV